MYSRIAVTAALAFVAIPAAADAQTSDRLNQMIAVHEKGQPVFGISHPGITAGGRGGGRGGRGGAADGSAAAPTPPPGPVLSDVAKQTVEYKLADYQFTAGASEAFLQYMVEIRNAGGSVRTHPFIAKVPVWQRNPESAAAAAIRQLNAGHVGIMMQSIESAAELRDGIKAIRFRQHGGTRPDEGIEAAAAYWGLTPEQYRQKADVWPLNKDGELLVWAIVESREGLARVREIAAEPGLGVMWVGWGTLGGVFSGDPEGREAAAQQVLAACKEFKVPCGFPTNNTAEVERRMKEGWSVFVMQSRNEAAFAAIEAGRKLGGR